MCDQTEVSYLENDVVWVKIGPLWWPGIVKDLEKDDEGRAILAGLKKKPIAAVKFFDEDNYEFVKNLDQIYHYNCRRKDEFIKKGLDKFRAGAPHLKKFPVDVTKAETLVNGNVDIVNDPKFFPEKKQSYSEIFGTGKKKTSKEGSSHSKSRSSKAGSGTSYRPITHRRFINKVLHGESDHQVKTLIQPSASPEDSSRGIYRCYVCIFKTSRVNVIVAHHRLAHSPKNSINWAGSEAKVVRRKLTYKPRKTKPKKIVESIKSDSSDDELLEKKKTKIGDEKTKLPSKSKGSTAPSSKGISLMPRKRNVNEEGSDYGQKKPRYTDVLLADWSEDDEEEKNRVKSRDDNDDNKDDCNEEDNSMKNNSDSADASGKEDVSGGEKGKDESKNQNEKMSCFDFDEEEEGFIGMSNANTYGRKIPRVIPVKDKSELGVDLDIGDLFKKKSENDPDWVNEDTSETNIDDSVKNESDTNNLTSEEVDKATESTEDEMYKDDVTEEASEEAPKRKRKSSKDQEAKVDEDSLAVRRTRRPGPKKSYMNEIVEKIEDDSPSSVEKTEEEPKEPQQLSIEVQNVFPRKTLKEDAPTSSSRRKQDLKLQTMENKMNEELYSCSVSSEKKEGLESPEKKPKEKKEKSKISGNDDLTEKIDHLLAETNVPNLPDIPAVSELSKAPNSSSISFDYVQPENNDKTEKSKCEVKSITKMFSESLKGNEVEEKDETSDDTKTSPSKRGSEVRETKPSQSQSIVLGGAKGASVLAVGASKQPTTDSDGRSGKSGAEENVPVLAGSKADGTGPGGDEKEAAETILESDNITKAKSIKTLKLKADNLPPSLLSSTGKLKGQTIIHQKGGTYVILSQPPQLPRQKIAAGKGPTSGKLVILTNQLGEQKIITTSGLQQSKFKIDAQKVAAGSSTGSPDSSPSGILAGKTQPIIKMVPDGKGGIMKKLTVSPKKVLVGGAKVLVSGSSGTFATQGSTIQKIALTSGNNLSGDFRLIENYKGSGKTVLIQGSSNASAGVLLKQGSTVQRHGIGETVQSSPNILNVKKKPKILMRATPSQNEYVVHSDLSGIDSPTYVMKRKGADGKFSTQKIIRRPVAAQTKSKPASPVSKAFILSSEQPVQKAESLIIKTNHEPANKIIRLTQKVREPDGKSKFAQKIIQKSSESYNVEDSSILAADESEELDVKTENAQMLQVTQNQGQQPILQTQVMAMPGPIGSDGNQTYVLVSVDEHGVVQPVDNSLITYDATAQSDPVFMNPGSGNNVIVLNPQTNEEIKPVFSNGSQDILAEALANTNVLEGNMSNDMETVMPSILLPPSIPSSVVQETSITLQKPIMTPLEMPTSVAPDTSGLEPPPLPPTPTEEDVLMEDQDAADEDGMRDEQLMSLENAKDESKKREYPVEKQDSSLSNESEMELPDANGEEDDDDEDDKSVGFYEGNAKAHFDHVIPREELLIENSQEGQGSSSLQSMPLLNDEPDTSDDAQGSEPIADQDFEMQKSRSESEELSSFLRDQEPPSSTNNEVMGEPKGDGYHGSFQETAPIENDKAQGDFKVKELSESKENQSMPVITDDGNVNSYTFGQVYVDALTQKRFQEETEVTSTTDEFSNKGSNIV